MSDQARSDDDARVGSVVEPADQYPICSVILCSPGPMAMADSSKRGR
jgi:hypothetical protein